MNDPEIVVRKVFGSTKRKDVTGVAKPKKGSDVLWPAKKIRECQVCVLRLCHDRWFLMSLAKAKLKRGAY
jgi:hypothetical protein